MKKNKGWAIHCHHDVMVEWCYDYKERVDYIKTEKPKHERETRLRLFKLLPAKAVKEIPTRLKEAGAKYGEVWAKYEEAGAKHKEAWARLREAGAKYEEARAECGEAGAKYEEARARHKEAWARLREARAEWRKSTEGKAFHDKWCGCKEWDGEQGKHMLNEPKLKTETRYELLARCVRLGLILNEKDAEIRALKKELEEEKADVSPLEVDE